MTEDRGAFKTIPRNSALSGHFVISRRACGMNAALLRKKFSAGLRPSPRRHFVTDRSAKLRYPRVWTDWLLCETASSCGPPRSPGLQTPANGNPHHAPWLSFPVRRNPVVDVGADLRTW